MKNDVRVDGRIRAVIDAVSPRSTAAASRSSASSASRSWSRPHCFTDGHDVLRVLLRWRAEDASEWREVEMQTRWATTAGARSFAAAEPSDATVIRSTAWVDHFVSWRQRFRAARGSRGPAQSRRSPARAWSTGAAERARGADRQAPGAVRPRSCAKSADVELLQQLGLDEELARARRAPPRPPPRHAAVRRAAARRSTASARASPPGTSCSRARPRPSPGATAPSRTCEARLAYVAELGFDVLYLPPIHPIGREQPQGQEQRARRRGPRTSAARGRSARPRAVTRRPPGARHARRISAAWSRRAQVTGHRDRARHRLSVRARSSLRQGPSGVVPLASRRQVQYAENPPKKYQDIYPFDFETEDWRALWAGARRACSTSGSAKACKIFRVDNPHTKSFAFWEWLIGRAQARAPGGDLPRRGIHAAQGDAPAGQARLHASPTPTSPGATPSTSSPSTSPSLRRARGASTSGPTSGRTRPDILHRVPAVRRPARVHGAPGAGGDAGGELRHLRAGLRAAGSDVRASPAARSTSTREKYQLRHWDLERADSLRDFIARVNRIRRENPALHVRPQPALLPHRQRAAHLLRQVGATRATT